MFEYTVMTISNLILKLAINTNKLGIIYIERLLLPSYLNIFTTSILFEKYLESEVLRRSRHEEDRRVAVRQLPKITVVRLSKNRNMYNMSYFKQMQEHMEREFEERQRTLQYYEVYEECL